MRHPWGSGGAPVGLRTHERAGGDAIPPIAPKTAKNHNSVFQGLIRNTCATCLMLFLKAWVVLSTGGEEACNVGLRTPYL